MRFVVFANLETGITIQSRTDGGIFNLRRLQSRSKATDLLVRDLLFADDCAFVANTLEDLQITTDRLADACQRLDFTVSLKKTELMLQPRPGSSYAPPNATISGTQLNVVDKFCCPGNLWSQVTMIDDDVTARIAKASSAFGCLQRWLWGDHGIRH